MANINEVAPGIWTGGDLPYDRAVAEEHVAEWREAGITHVSDNRMEWSDEELVAQPFPGESCQVPKTSHAHEPKHATRSGRASVLTSWTRAGSSETTACRSGPLGADVPLLRVPSLSVRPRGGSGAAPRG